MRDLHVPAEQHLWGVAAAAVGAWSSSPSSKNFARAREYDRERRACSLDLDELAGSVRYSTLPQIISSLGMRTLGNTNLMPSILYNLK